jgi:hypothetical protein
MVMPTNIDLKQLESAKAMFDAGQKQARLRDVFGATQGTKYYMLCWLDQQHPGLEIIERCMDGRLKIPALSHRALQLLRDAPRDTVANYFK